jgi:hypothetical protein
MINSQEVLGILQINGLNKDSSLESVTNILTQLQYSDVDKQEVYGLLKSQGWFPNSSDIPQTVNNINTTPNQVTTQPAAVSTTGGSNKALVSIIILIIILLLAGGGLVYAYIQKIGPFSSSGYNESNLFSGILEKISQINSATYSASGSLSVIPRDKDAVPFVIKESSDALKLKQQYDNDFERLKNASSIIDFLSRKTNYSPFFSADEEVISKLSYPATLKSLTSLTFDYEMSNGGSRSKGFTDSIVDPVTKKEYEYKTTDGGKNFILNVDFETNHAIDAIKDSYKYKAVDTIIVGKKVSFTRDSSSYMPMSIEAPKPFIVGLSESLENLPADVKVSADISVSSELKKEGMADWLFNVNAQGDLGDLSYKVNADALKKGNNYYFRINNIPSLFLFGDLSSIKGKWVNFASNAASSTSDNGYSSLSYLKDGIPELEKSYKENNKKAISFIKEMVEIADDLKVVSFKNTPKTEKVDGRDLIRYELSLKKDSILPFYQKVQEEINKNPDFSEYKNIVDQGLLDYLQSQEFEDVFSYIDKNNTFILWTDTEGFPAMTQNTMRVVPPDTAIQLKDKQINIVTKIVISNINKPLDIKAPVDSVPLQEIIDDYSNNL